MARKVCMSVAAFKKLVGKKHCSCSSGRSHKKRRGRKRRRGLPPRGRHGQFRKRRRHR